MATHQGFDVEGELAMQVMVVIQVFITGPLHKRFLETEMGLGVVHQIIEDPGHAQLGIRLTCQAVKIVDVVDDTPMLLVDQQDSQFVIRAPYDAHDPSPVCDAGYLR